QEKALYFPSASMGRRHKRGKRSFNSRIKKGLRGQRRWAIRLYEVQEANNGNTSSVNNNPTVECVD
ncbi:unnamed protein product, partial [Rhizophagus irregularis]